MRVKRSALTGLIKTFLKEQQETEEVDKQLLEDLVVVDAESGIKYRLETEASGAVNFYIDDEVYSSDNVEDIKIKIAAITSKAYADGVLKGKANEEQQALIRQWVDLTIEGGLEKVANSTQRLSVVFDAMSGSSEEKNKIS